MPSTLIPDTTGEPGSKPPDGVTASRSTAALCCVGCDYDLTGSTVGGDCPECGLSIRRTVEGRRGLTRRQATAIALRLLALVILVLNLELISWIVFLGLTLLGLLGAQMPRGQDLWGYVLVMLIPLLLQVAAAVGLWWKAPWLAGLIVHRDGQLVDATSRVSAQHLMSLLLIVAGVCFTVVGGAQVASAAWSGLSLMDPSLPYSQSQSHWLGGGVLTVAGLLLMFSGRLKRRLARAI